MTMKTHGNDRTKSMENSLQKVKRESFEIIRDILADLKENSWEIKDSLTVAYKMDMCCHGLINVKKVSYIPVQEVVVDEYFGYTEIEPDYILVEGYDEIHKMDVQINFDFLLPGEEIGIINKLPATAEIANIILTGLKYFDGQHEGVVNSTKVVVSVNADKRQIYVNEGGTVSFIDAKDTENIIGNVHQKIFEGRAQGHEEEIFIKEAVASTWLPF
jgi:predicted transcriptional regulator